MSRSILVALATLALATPSFAEVTVLAATGGIPYEQETQITMGGKGPTAGMLAKMDGITMTQTVQSVETGALAADLFAPPAGDQLKEQK